MCGTERSQARGVQVLGRHEGQFSSEEDFYITKVHSKAVRRMPRKLFGRGTSELSVPEQICTDADAKSVAGSLSASKPPPAPRPPKFPNKGGMSLASKAAPVVPDLAARQPQSSSDSGPSGLHAAGLQNYGNQQERGRMDKSMQQFLGPSRHQARGRKSEPEQSNMEEGDRFSLKTPAFEPSISATELHSDFLPMEYEPTPLHPEAHTTMKDCVHDDADFTEFLLDIVLQADKHVVKAVQDPGSEGGALLGNKGGSRHPVDIQVDATAAVFSMAGDRDTSMSLTAAQSGVTSSMRAASMPVIKGNQQEVRKKAEQHDGGRRRVGISSQHSRNAEAGKDLNAAGVSFEQGSAETWFSSPPASPLRRNNPSQPIGHLMPLTSLPSTPLGPPTKPLPPPSSPDLPAGGFNQFAQPFEDGLFENPLLAQTLPELRPQVEAAAGDSQDHHSLRQHGTAITHAAQEHHSLRQHGTAITHAALLYSEPAAAVTMPPQAVAPDAAAAAAAVTGSTGFGHSVTPATKQQLAIQGNHGQLPFLRHTAIENMHQPLSPSKTGSHCHAEQCSRQHEEGRRCNDEGRGGVRQGLRRGPARPHRGVAHPVISKGHPSRASASRQTGAVANRLDKATASERVAAGVSKRFNKGRRVPKLSPEDLEERRLNRQHSDLEDNTSQASRQCHLPMATTAATTKTAQTFGLIQTAQSKQKPISNTQELLTLEHPSQLHTTGLSISAQQHIKAADNSHHKMTKSGTSETRHGSTAASHSRAAAGDAYVQSDAYSAAQARGTPGWASTAMATAPSTDSIKGSFIAQQDGGRKKLLPTAAVPAVMAVAMDIDFDAITGSSGQKAGSKGKRLPSKAAAKGQSKTPLHAHKINPSDAIVGRRKRTLEDAREGVTHGSLDKADNNESLRPIKKSRLLASAHEGTANTAVPSSLPRREAPHDHVQYVMSKCPKPAASKLTESQQRADKRMNHAIAASRADASVKCRAVSCSLATAIKHLDHAAKAAEGDGNAERCVAALHSACHAVANASEAHAGSSCASRDKLLKQAHQLLIHKLAAACLLRLCLAERKAMKAAGQVASPQQQAEWRQRGQDLARLRQEESNKEGALRRVFFGSKQDTSGAQQQMVDLVLYLRPNIAHGSLNNMVMEGNARGALARLST